MFRKLFGFLTATILAAAIGLSLCSCGAEEVKTRGEITAEYMSVVAEVRVGNTAGSAIVMSASASEAVVATCYHVTGASSDAALIRFYGDDEFVALGECMGYDRRYDVAFFRVSHAGGVSKKFETSTANIGDEVTVLGNAAGYGISAFDGIVSKLDDIQTVSGYTKPLIRVTAAVNGGTSGGAAFDEKGKLVGMAVARYSSDGYEQMGYVLPANILLSLYDLAVASPSANEIQRADIRAEESEESDNGLVRRETKISVSRGEKSYTFVRVSGGWSDVICVNGEKLPDSVSDAVAKLISYGGKVIEVEYVDDAGTRQKIVL